MTDGVRLSRMQEQLFLLERFGSHEADPPRYHFGARLDFHGRLKVDALRGALGVLTAKHPLLRSGFTWRAGVGPTRTVAQQESLPPPPEPLEVSGEHAMSSIVDGMLGEAFDLSRPPLLRWGLFRLAETHHVLLHMEHHLLHDGVSFRILLRDLAEAYNAMVDGGRAPVDGSDGFALFAERERAWLGSTAARTAKESWLTRIRPLLTAQPLHWGADAGRAGHRSTHRRAIFDALHWQALSAEASRQRCTTFAFMLWAFVGLIAKLVGTGPGGLGIGYANRRLWHEFRDVVGPMVNVLPIMVGPGVPSKERLARMVMDGFRYQELPLSFLLQGSGCARHGDRNPLFQVCFTAQTGRTRLCGFSGLEVRVTEGLATPGAKFDLNVILVPPLAGALPSEHAGSFAGSDGAALIWESDGSVLPEQTSAELLAEYLASVNERLSGRL
jgi:hypothetical protein